jgi:hypothetical protein
MGMLGGTTYEFSDSNKVTFILSTDMPGTGFRRTGTYSRMHDTIKIQFEPLINIAYQRERDTSTVVHLRSMSGEPLTYFQVTVFFNDLREDYFSDENGRIEFSHKPASIDSTYWEWRFAELGIYPGTYANFPPIQEYSEFIVTINTEVTFNWPYATDQSSLLVIGENKLFNGVNYDPNAIYPANMGILTKK